MNFVSVVVPCYNEEKSIRFLLDALNNQKFPKDEFEVIIVDGLSSDTTLAVISDYQLNHPQLDVKVISNPKRNIPAAVNLGILGSNGEIIVRMDAHSIPDENYIRFCVENLENNIAANVGGRWNIVPGSESKMSRCIALAASHPFGVGDAKYRYSETAGYVDTVPFGSFYKSLTNQIGLFDEKLLANEDYEFNVRIRNSGNKIYFDPRIQTQYIARSNIKDLAKQYWRYGFWKFKMLKKYPGTLRWRQAIPPIFVTGIMLLIIMSFFSTGALFFLLAILSIYLIALMIGIVPFVKKTKDLICLLGVPLSIVVMHFSWGLGFLYSLMFGRGTI
ncbi:MAG TPA: glycosyltransferase family 2 protein [Anaerolineaceae bacterium]|nr:glycosyltransferase family 2 protein [Anaerolineaceae bacterium]